jgi:HK97 family phage prohead protease
MVDSKLPFTFFTDEVQCKSEGEGEGQKFYVEGYAATSDIDRFNEMVTESCMKSMLDQIKGATLSIKLDNDHETWRDPKNGRMRYEPQIVPAGRIVDARVDLKGLYIKAEMNKHLPGFKSLWGSLQDKFVDSFSIAYDVLKVSTKSIGGKVIKLLENVKLLNIALTGNPVNPGARITAVMAKSLTMTDVTEDDTMTEEHIEPVASAITAPINATPAVEAASALELKSITEVVSELRAELKSVQDARAEEARGLAELKSRLEKAEEALARPALKSKSETAPTSPAVSAKTPLQLIK